MALLTGIAICAAREPGTANTRAFACETSGAEPVVIDESATRLALFVFNYGPEDAVLLWANTGAVASNIARLTGDVVFGVELGPISAKVRED